MAEDKLSIDILSPEAVTKKAETIGVKKARNALRSTVMLGVLAGAFIAMAGEFYTLAVVDTGLGFSLTKLIGGFVFSLGLILVVVTGAELFTGNTLLIIAYMTRKITLKELMRNWVLVYLGNFIGAVGIAVLVFYAKQYTLKEYHFALEALKIAQGKLANDFFTALVRGILANLLVVMAVWLSYAGRSLADKFLAVILPVSAFVASGFEHSIANMYFVPFAIFIKSLPEVIGALQKSGYRGDISTITWANFLVKNLIPVTIGNIIGGGFLVGLVYWFVYLYKRK
ncbi:hypothetical protein ciss_11650 [Carboxydothermus islandicus]|uniref:Formate transporter FocA n=1 Tax=Carboxydothermus islandicus TaxID=661089 RepID=A0A1L8D228_9THEO|nr:formate transporter FocA [Carboxydothermus islandicus]GAV25232.1 hypothetical protein ciss_11650 [Carboxydothermus islandicus]